MRLCQRGKDGKGLALAQKLAAVQCSFVVGDIGPVAGRQAVRAATAAAEAG